MRLKRFEHLSAEDHNYFLNNCTITLVDKSDDSDPTRRGRYSTKFLKTAAPYESNTLQ